jgi:AhpD family alkylhydroperoxidase
VNAKNDKETIMQARLDNTRGLLAMKVVKGLNSAGAALHATALPAATQELVKLRASQINGCGFCTDMHIKDALHAGESQQRLNLVAAWREATVFTEAERAALELTDHARDRPRDSGPDHRPAFTHVPGLCSANPRVILPHQPQSNARRRGV